MKNLTTLCLLLLCALQASAQNSMPVFGSVIDAFLKRPIPQAKVSIMTADSVMVQDSVPLRKVTNSEGAVTQVQYSTSLKAGKYLVRASLKGYTDAWQKIEIPEQAAGIYMVDPLELRRERTVNLSEVTVTATRVKMYYKGDTLVYNATEFQLPDGSMLDDLIRQLPGVTMNQHGEIFVNGRKIEELQLGSRSFFRGNSKVLLENLPYYTVKDIKVYEQDTDRNRALGYAVEKKKFVMDVNLKPEYNRGLIGNIEAAGGTKERYLGRGFLLAFTDPYRFTLLVNSNNVNEERHVGQTNSWSPATMPRSLLTSHSVAGEISYQSADKNRKDELTAEFTSTKNESETRQRRELFLDGLIPVQTSQASDIAKANKFSVKNRFRLIKPFYLGVDAGFVHNTYSGNAAMLSEQFNDTLVTRMREEGTSEGRSWNVNFNAGGAVKAGLKKGQLVYGVDIKHKDEETGKAREYAFDKPLAAMQYNTNDYSQRQTVASGSIGTDHGIGFAHMNLRVGYEYTDEQTHDYLYHPDTLVLPSELDALQAITDRSNSYDSRYRTHKVPVWLRLIKIKYIKDYHPMMGEYNRDYSPWEVNCGVDALYRELDYRRGSLDTLASRTNLSGYLSFTYDLYPRKRYEKHWKFMAYHRFSPASLFDAIDYRDDSQPLVVKLGNPDLKSNQNSLLAVDFWRRTKEAMNQHHFELYFAYYHRQTAQSVSYNPQSGAYTYRPVNVNGAYQAQGKFDISRVLDKKKRWTWQTNVNGSYMHSIDHAVMEGMTDSRENTVNTLTLGENTYIQYSKGKLNLRATSDVTWRHSEGRMRSFSTLNAIDFSYGFSGRYTLPFGLTVASDLKMYSRRGYGSTSMNTNDLVWNASLSQPLIKGKLIARLEGFDLLHQLSSTQYEVNAQGRIETWNRSLPNYVMLHLQWMFNKNPKKKMP